MEREEKYKQKTEVISISDTCPEECGNEHRGMRAGLEECAAVCDFPVQM